MFTCPGRYLLICTLLLAVPAAFASPVIVNADFGAVPINCGDLGFAYQGTGGCGQGYWAQDFNSAPGFGWTLSTSHDQDWYGPGVTGPNTAFNPPSFDGLPFTRAAFLQTGPGVMSSVSQDVAGFSPGDYTLSFYMGTRIGYGAQTVEALIDGSVIGTWTMTDAPFAREFATFNVSTGGDHTLEFLATDDSGDHTAFLSGVSIAEGVPEPSSLVLLVTSMLGGLAKFYRDGKQEALDSETTTATAGLRDQPMTSSL